MKRRGLTALAFLIAAILATGTASAWGSAISWLTAAAATPAGLAAALAVIHRIHSRP